MPTMLQPEDLQAVEDAARGNHEPRAVFVRRALKREVDRALAEAGYGPVADYVRTVLEHGKFDAPDVPVEAAE
jgi:hypothetical protein